MKKVIKLHKSTFDGMLENMGGKDEIFISSQKLISKH